VSYYRPIYSKELLRWATETGVIVKIKQAISNTSLPQNVLAALYGVDEVFRNGEAYVDLNDVTQRQLLEALVQNGVITADEKAYLLDIAEVTGPRYKSLGYDEFPTDELDEIFPPEPASPPQPDNILVMLNCSVGQKTKVLNLTVYKAAGNRPVKFVRNIRATDRSLPKDQEDRELVNNVFALLEQYRKEDALG